MISDDLLRRALGPGLARRHGDLVRYLVTALAVTVLLLWLGYQLLLGRYMYTALHMNDFGKFYYSTRLFLGGGDMYGPSPATGIPVGPREVLHFWNMNPPHFHLLLIPLAYLRPAWAFAGWWAAGLVALFVSVRIIAREAGAGWTRRGLFWTVFWLALVSPMSTTVLTGQVSLLLMLALTSAWRDARHGRWIRSALLLGVAASVKPFLGLFLPWLLWRQPRAAGAMVAAGTGCFLAGLVTFGPDAYAGWFGALTSMNWSWVPFNGSVVGLLSRTFADSPRFLPLVEAPWLASALSIAAFIGLTVIAFAVLVRDRSSHAVDRAFAGLILTALAVSPLGWIYYLFLAGGPLFVLWQAIERRPARGRDLLIAMAVPGLIWPVAMAGLFRLTPWGPVTFGSVYGWTTLALWGAVLIDAHTAREAAPG